MSEAATWFEGLSRSATMLKNEVDIACERWLSTNKRIDDIIPYKEGMENILNSNTRLVDQHTLQVNDLIKQVVLHQKQLDHLDTFCGGLDSEVRLLVRQNRELQAANGFLQKQVEDQKQLHSSLASEFAGLTFKVKAHMGTLENFFDAHKCTQRSVDAMFDRDVERSASFIKRLRWLLTGK